MGLRDLMRKKEGLYEHDVDADTVNRLANGAPEFNFIRSDTSAQGIIHGSGAAPTSQDGLLTASNQQQQHSRLSLRSRSRSASASSYGSATSSVGGGGGGGGGGGLLSPGGGGYLSPGGDREHVHRRLSQRLGLRRATPSSEHVPNNLPEIQFVAGSGADPTSPVADTDARETLEAQWEQRATLLAQSRGGPPSPGGVPPGRAVLSVAVSGSAVTSPVPSPTPSPTVRSPIPPIAPLSPMSTFGGGDTPPIDNGRFTPFRPGAGSKPSPPISRSQSQGPPSRPPPQSPIGTQAPQFPQYHHPNPLNIQQPPTPRQPPPTLSIQTAPPPVETPEQLEAKAAQARGQAIDSDIQKAIKLHESGSLEESTRMFGRLADPNGANNPLSQVLYGLALRHGWGCEADPADAVKYLSQAAANAAVIEQLALQAGLKKGGAAKGELVLAIFELANCFRHGWGIEKDAIAAKQYYETAANLGDTDAMNEAAWCYLEGFGCKKDKYAAARYYRLAEKNGSKTLGNTWIWKDKYDDGGKKGKKKR